MASHPEEPKKALLRDDHPLLERFQATLNAHLLRVKAKLEEECLDIENTLKEREEEQKEVGASLYDAQQQILYQRRQLKELATGIEETREKSRKLEDETEATRKEAEEVQSQLANVTRKYQENLVTVQNLNDLANYMQKWHGEAEDALKVATRITKKDAQEKLAKVEEKRKLDVFVLSLEAEVRRRENELNDINEQIKESTAHLEKFNRNLTDANADCEALQHEQRRLMQAWGEVILAIQQRDKMLAAANQELHEEYERHKDLRGHIEGARKEIHRQSVQNEKLEGFLNRLTGDLQCLERQLGKEAKEMEKVLDAFNNKQLIYEQTEVDLQKAQLEGVILENQLRSIKHKIELQEKAKVAMEEQILDILQEQISTDKAGQYRAKILRENQETRRNMEIQISATENDLSRVLLELERVRGSVVRYQEMQEKFERDEAEMKGILDRQDDDLRGTLTQINLQQRTLDCLAKQLEEAVEALGGREVSPEENRIIDLKQDLTELDKKMNESQSAWLKLQHHLVNLNEKRSRQTNEIYIARKQDLIIEQKYRKIEREIAEITAEEEKINREMQNLNQRIKFLGNQVFSRQIKNTDKEVECNRNFDMFYDKLRGSETQVLTVEEEIAHLERELQTLKDSVVDKNREIFSWDGKYKTIVEVKRYQNAEASVDGEIHRMQMEIHRMEIRYGQLKRAQERLMQDLDNCVVHREKIFNQSLVRSKVPLRSRRSGVEEKIVDIKARIKQINRDCQQTEKSGQELLARKQELEGELRRRKYEIECELEKDQQILLQTEEAQLLRHGNLEAIVKCQKRAKRYKAILMNAYPPKCRSEASIDNRMEQQVEVQEQLLSFVTSLTADFPNQQFALARTLQTLNNNDH